MIRRLRLKEVSRQVGSGRTKPLFCSCEGLNSDPAGDFVLKILGSAAEGNRGPMFELIASRLASHFGILTPEPVAVTYDQQFSDLLADRFPARKGEFDCNVGYNFASAYLNPISPWPVKQDIPAKLRQEATDIFAFDCLIQNVDRRIDNPNLFVHEGHFYVYDHELAFSFLFDVLPSATPWILQAQGYLDNHVFRRRLPRATADLANFSTRLQGLTDNTIGSIRDDIPEEWMHPCLDRIEEHLRLVRAHDEEFAAEVKARLL